MAKRAYAQIVEISTGSPNESGIPGFISIRVVATYLNVDAVTQSTSTLPLEFVSGDASVREILDVAVAATIQHQPAGFSLVEHDVIVTSLDRG